jgi:ATP-dependent helicase/nuclease subunit A
MADLRLPFDDAPPESASDVRDRAARARAVDPRYNVALEASAGTGKTRVLVDRYVNLLRAGVDPANILAMTFTRKAAADMRERVLARLRDAAARGEIAAGRWRELRDRTGDIAISTIDAFCLGLLREFPLEADLDPGFEVADDTEVPRLVDESLDRALRTCRTIARDDDAVALVFAQLGERRVRSGLTVLLNRRLVAPRVLASWLARHEQAITVQGAAARTAASLVRLFGDGDPSPTASAADLDAGPGDGGLLAFAASGPSEPAFALLVSDLERLERSVHTGEPPEPAHVQAALTRGRDYFLTRGGQPRSRLTSPKAAFPSESHWRRHRDLVQARASGFAATLAAFRRDINVVVSRGIWRMFRIAEAEYRRTLDAYARVDFADLLLRALALLRQMEEFAQSRYRLESRYHHVLVDEFQDTSRAQWDLISLLVQSWGEGAGLAGSTPLPPTIFIVGDRKQSIYGFRDADVSVLEEAARYIGRLRPDGDVRRSISRSFRATPELLAFVNDVCREVDKAGDRPDAFRFDEQDEFPVDEAPTASDALHAIVGETPEACADRVSAEIARLLSANVTVRDVATGVRRRAAAGDIGILFRTREGHRDVVDALDRRNIPAYVYKGLGFFDAAEVRDVLALLGHLADPTSELRAAAWLRSGFVRLSDEGLRRLAPDLAGALCGSRPPIDRLDASDAGVLALAHGASTRWRRLADRLSPAELLDLALSESAYAYELRGRRHAQARENLKKMRGLVRRAQNSGYATLARIVDHLDRLAVGDDSAAAVEARDAVNLMTVHAAKGLEFPIVFVVNLARGTTGRRDPIRVSGSPQDDLAVSVGDFESEADEDRDARDREETKRLLYVALTRARDRLYLSTPLDDGRVRPGRGSLAEVLPAGLLEALAQAPAGPMARWQARSGGTYVFTASPPAVGDAPLPCGESPPARTMPDHFARFLPGPEVVDDPPVAPSSTQTLARLQGTLVHRVLQQTGPSASGGPDAAELAARLIRPDECEEIDDVGKVCADVAGMCASLLAHEEVQALLTAGVAVHEVPFVSQVDGHAVRGTIDCLVRWVDQTSGESRVTVLEFKTGSANASHLSQAARYAAACRILFPGVRVDARLVYPGGIVHL